MPKKPEYVSIAEALKTELLAGRYDDEQLPSSTALAERFDVNLKTAGRAVQQLVAEGMLIARPGMRAIPVPRNLRATRWPMTGRYARARAAHGLIFDSDVVGNLRKETVHRQWERPPEIVARLLDVNPEESVFHRRSRTYVNDIATEDTSMYFPASVIDASPKLEREENIRVVSFLEEAGFVVTRTTNELRARHASQVEQGTFRLDADGIVIEHAHGTYGAEGEALEAVINIRPARDNVVTFDTYEAPISEGQEQ
ncbi:UTRA domain-containing protein [Pseudonocardia sp. GCM10023141]|uniref:UTRA domain-containing protein n=1 Tax=Pseudonocardia sp. GCM10023141 TaxID=3252653 RepID=UPI00360BB04E